MLLHNKMIVELQLLLPLVEALLQALSLLKFLRKILFTYKPCIPKVQQVYLYSTSMCVIVYIIIHPDDVIGNNAACERQLRESG